MGSAVLNLSGTVSGIPSGQQLVNVTWNLPSAVGEVLTTILAVGDNLIPVPSGAATMLIQPPDNNSVSITVRTVVGDTGFPIHPQVPWFGSLGGTVSGVYVSIPSPLSGPVGIAFY